jgi:hypothetical protein
VEWQEVLLELCVCRPGDAWLQRSAASYVCMIWACKMAHSAGLAPRAAAHAAVALRALRFLKVGIGSWAEADSPLPLPALCRAQILFEGLRGMLGQLPAAQICALQPVPVLLEARAARGEPGPQPPWNLSPEPAQAPRRHPAGTPPSMYKP